MKCFSELNGTSVPVHVHAHQDILFKKKPVCRYELVFRIQGEVSPFFSHINHYGGEFKICLIDPSDESAAQAEFERKINELNGVLLLLSNESFINSVIVKCESVLKGIDTYVRGENGNLRPAYEVRSLFSDALVSYLKTKGIEAKCNIQRGTLYVGGDVIINSGITYSTPLSAGIIDFVGFKSTADSLRHYMDEYHKAPIGLYEPGSWTNRLGDRPFAVGLSLLILEALEGFLTKAPGVIGLATQDSVCVSVALQSTLERKAALQKEHDSLFQVLEFDTKPLLTHEVVQAHDLYKELMELGLGDVAKWHFAQKEAPMILLKYLASAIGATDVVVYHPHDEYERANKNGFFDEDSGPHVALPNTKTRKGMMALKNALNDSNSLASCFFDASRLRLNVASSFDYDQQRNEVVTEWELVDVCMGVKSPLVRTGELVRFIFEL